MGSWQLRVVVKEPNPCVTRHLYTQPRYMVLEFVAHGPVMTYDAPRAAFVAAAPLVAAAAAARGGEGAGGEECGGGVPMCEASAARCLSDVAAGLAYLHLHAIAHRDLKVGSKLSCFRASWFVPRRVVHARRSRATKTRC